MPEEKAPGLEAAEPCENVVVEADTHNRKIPQPRAAPEDASPIRSPGGEKIRASR